ncbi:mechanosensitive ion channel family protein [Clostridium rectalis]|uniref:mechanosensitive ion channel family protein n=1 Tax=Clostridium rectalis TaxID=2040295 RepID=UPI000F635CDC|nr:mechanosensitive ion channel family protein [Clostridium rectalis]
MENAIKYFKNFFNEIFSNFKQEYIYTVIGKCIKILLVIFFMCLTIKIGNKIINRFVEKQSEMRFSLDERKSKTLGAILKSILKYSVYFVGIFILIDIVFNIKALTFAGIGGVVIGFGAQNLIKDIINGFFILFEDQYAVGDYISIQNKSGIVESIELRITKIRDFNGDLHIIPNGSINDVTNHSRGSMRVLVDVDISSEENIDKVINLINQVCLQEKQNKNIVNTPSVTGITAMKENIVTIRVVGRAKSMTQWDIEMDLRRKIKDVLDKENIKRPYPRVKILKEE